MPETLPGCVYKITSPSNKIYIGLTSFICKKRLIEHVKNAKRNGNNLLITKAIRKYKIENMIVDVLVDGIDDFEKLKDLEVFYISKFNSVAPNGYNCTEGGDGTKGFFTALDIEKQEKQREVSRASALKTLSNIDNYNNFRNGALKYVRSEEGRLAAKNRILALNTDPAFRERNKISFINRCKTDEVKEAIRLGIEKRNKNPEWIKAQGLRLRKYYDNPENCKKHLEILAIRNADPDFQKRRLEAMRKVTSTKEWKEANLERNKKKAKIKEIDYPYILEKYISGKTVKELAEEYEVSSKQTIYNILKKMGYKNQKD